MFGYQRQSVHHKQLWTTLEINLDSNAQRELSWNERQSTHSIGEDPYGMNIKKAEGSVTSFSWNSSNVGFQLHGWWDSSRDVRSPSAGLHQTHSSSHGRTRCSLPCDSRQVAVAEQWFKSSNSAHSEKSTCLQIPAWQKEHLKPLWSLMIQRYMHLNWWLGSFNAPTRHKDRVFLWKTEEACVNCR